MGIAAVFLSTGFITLHVMRTNWREFQLSASAEQNYDTVRERQIQRERTARSREISSV